MIRVKKLESSSSGPDGEHTVNSVEERMNTRTETVEIRDRRGETVIEWTDTEGQKRAKLTIYNKDAR